MKKYPKIKYPEDSSVSGLFADGRVYIQEKIDGGNGRFTLEENIEDKYETEERDIVFGSRRVAYKNKKDETNQFGDSIEYVRDNVDTNIIRGYDDKYGGLIFYGEYMEPHTIREGYNWNKWQGKFVGFDIWSIEQSKFLQPETVEQIYDSIGLPYAQILGSYTVEEWNNGDTIFHNEDCNWPSNDEWCPETDFGDGIAEGIVIKNPTTQTYAKMVREDFKEKHSTGSMKTEEKDAEKLSYQYITDARIEKTVHKLVDEGKWDSINMGMMQDLPKEVIKDMIEEEGFNIFMYEDWEIDLSHFRSITSDRCSRVLRRMINLESNEK